MKYIYQIVFICTVLSTFIVSIFQYRYGTVQYHYPIFKKNKKIHYGTRYRTFVRENVQICCFNDNYRNKKYNSMSITYIPQRGYRKIYSE